MVEPTRKHGVFDRRYPGLSTPATPTWVLDVETGLDWAEFSTRFFPHGCRHDIKALQADGAYESAQTPPPVSKQRERESPLGIPTPALSHHGRGTGWKPRNGTTPKRSATPALSSAVTIWEGEGGHA
jgi:hypothetical protein